ncbi:hypothetical protein Thermo_01976 [Thermoplasmatales archaeon]|nr:hypothetical protein Thermo_01976 [Thermoplasmatales archaeon]
MNSYTHSNERKQSGPVPIVYVGIGFSVISLALGIIIGISALAENNGFSLNNGIAADITFHPDLMVFGVIGGLLITEKLELMEKFSLFGYFRISRMIVSLLFSGVFISSAGIWLQISAMQDLGLLLVAAASILFLYYMTSRRNPGMAYVKHVSGAAILGMFLSAIANLNQFITESNELTYLVLLFPVVYVLAERMELGYIRGMKVSFIRTQSILSWILVITAFLSVEINVGPFPRLLMLTSIAILIFLVVGSVYFDPSFRHLIKKNRLQSYIQKGIVISYLWLFLGIILFIMQAILGHGFLDPAAHSIALGFIGTFIVAHSPIIFPLTLKKKAVQENVTLLPIIIITVANFMRIFGDISLHYLWISAAISYASAYVLLVAIIAFVYNLRRIMYIGAPKNSVEVG